MSLPSALRLLDEVLTLRQLEAFSAERFLGEIDGDGDVAAPSLAELEARLDGLRQALGAIESFASKAMKIRLAHALEDAPVTPQFQTYLASMVTAYDRDLPLLRSRVLAAAARVDARRASETANAVVEAAEQVLSLRTTLGLGLLERTGRIAGAWVAPVQAAARDRTASDAERLPWRVARAELTLLAEHPERLAEGDFAERCKKLPPPEEEPVEEAPRKRYDLLEID